MLNTLDLTQEQERRKYQEKHFYRNRKVMWNGHLEKIVETAGEAIVGEEIVIENQDGINKPFINSINPGPWPGFFNYEFFLK